MAGERELKKIHKKLPGKKKEGNKEDREET